MLSVLAMSHYVSWLSDRTDEIAVLHSWLNDHLHWLRRWWVTVQSSSRGYARPTARRGIIASARCVVQTAVVA